MNNYILYNYTHTDSLVHYSHYFSNHGIFIIVLHPLHNQEISHGPLYYIILSSGQGLIRAILYPLR
jgi:hypothetical protein